jgi:hypothetical protein
MSGYQWVVLKTELMRIIEVPYEMQQKQTRRKTGEIMAILRARGSQVLGNWFCCKSASDCQVRFQLT